MTGSEVIAPWITVAAEGARVAGRTACLADRAAGGQRVARAGVEPGCGLPDTSAFDESFTWMLKSAGTPVASGFAVLSTILMTVSEPVVAPQVMVPTSSPFPVYTSPPVLVEVLMTKVPEPVRVTSHCAFELLFAVLSATPLKLMVAPPLSVYVPLSVPPLPSSSCGATKWKCAPPTTQALELMFSCVSSAPACAGVSEKPPTPIARPRTRAMRTEKAQGAAIAA